MYQVLDEALQENGRGAKARRNARTILIKLWFRVDSRCASLRQRALRLSPSLSPGERLVLHWGMALLAYPFFRDIVHEMGRLFAFQDAVAGHQIARKVKTLYGDRRRVGVAATAVLGSMKAWGVVEAGADHLYRQSMPIVVERPELKRWLTEVLLHAFDEQWMVLELIPSAPALFPFRFSLKSHELEKTTLQLVRQGGNMTMVGIEQKKGAIAQK
ncbi:hypothetical protein [Kyrpidia tusciae]|uniref:hypothetical protein n=1 Tax=Kyrpidia tusciae TaxID=33943 RepID=UPI001C54DCCD|nr:hypothetical protein [Kyrpidia tusciae]